MRGPRSGPPVLLAAFVLLLIGATWAPAVVPRQALGVQLLEGANAAWTQPRRSQLRDSYSNESLDDPQQRAALLAILDATGGSNWSVSNTSAPGASPWGTLGVSYCRWLGVTCCATSPLSLVECDGLHSVAILSLDGFGLVGTLPEAVGRLPELTVLALANNPGLGGALPDALSRFPHLLWMSVEDTSILACQEGSRDLVTGPCTLPSSLSFTAQPYSPHAMDALLCPAAILTSFLSYTSDVSPDLWDMLTSPFPAPPTPGAVIADGNFTGFFNCSCSRSGQSLVVQEGGGVVQCLDAGGNAGDNGRMGLIIAVVIVAIVPWLLVAAAVYICVVHKATLNRLVRRKEAEMARKRSKVPGTPGVALQNGRGVLSLSDVMVTWVVTDVAASTQLWEWKPDVMDRAIDMHNVALRQLMDEFGGHEIRNEGDSFTLSFHDAVDAVTFCLKAQEKLMTVEWPKELVEHQRTSTVSVGDVTSNPDAAGKGLPLIAGLRVRMGINTGVPDDIFLHDLTDHVDYRGLEYDLAGEICDLAEGGQVLMGPRTLQRWNKVNYSALIDPLTADLLRDQQGGSFLQGGGGAPLPHGTSGRRGSVTGYGSNLTGGGMLGLARESTQLQMYYGSNAAPSAAGGMGDALPRPGGSTGHALSMMPTFRRNSDTHPLVHNGGFARLSDAANEGSDDDIASSARPSAGAAGAPLGVLAPRSLRLNRMNSPIRRGQNASGRMDGNSSDGTGGGGGGKPQQLLSPLAIRNRSKLGSPRSIQFSSMSYNDRTRAAAVRGEDVEGAGRSAGYGYGGRAVRRVNSMEGLARLHAVRAAELAAAASGGQSSTRSSIGTRPLPNGGSGGMEGGGGAAGTGGAATEGSDEERESSRRPVPSRNASGPLQCRAFNARSSVGGMGVGEFGSGRGGARRRRAGPGGAAANLEEPEEVVSAPLLMPPGLQRWLSHGWRGLPGPLLTRPHTSMTGSMPTAASAATATFGAGAGGGSSALGQSLGSGTAQRSAPGAGTRVLWSRMNGGLPPSGRPIGGVAIAPSGAAGGGGPGLLGNNGSNGTDGPSSQPVPHFTADEEPAGSGSHRTLQRVASLPAAAAGAVAAGLSRLAALSALNRREGAGSSEAPSREASVRHHNPLFLRNNSREGSRDSRLPGDASGAATPVRADSQGPTHYAGAVTQSGLSAVAASASPAATTHHNHPDTQDPATLATAATFAHLLSGGRRSMTAAGSQSPPMPFPSTSGPGPGSQGPGSYGSTVEISRGGGGGGRRGMGPGAPRMSLTSDAGLGLHPLLLNPMQPGSGGGGGGIPVMHPMLGRMGTGRLSLPLLGNNTRPSPLGLSMVGARVDSSSTQHLPAMDPGPTGDSVTSAGGGFIRGLTVASTFRQVTHDTYHDMGGGNGPSGGTAHLPSSAGNVNGDSGGLMHVHPGNSGGGGMGLGGAPHPQHSYARNTTGGGYYPDVAEQDGLGSGGGASLGGPLGLRAPEPPLVLRLLDAVRVLWYEMLSAFRAMMRRCLRCVRLLTSSDDDPADVDMWAHADSTIVGGGLGGVSAHHKSAAAGSKATETKGVLVDMGYYNFMSVDYNGQGPVGHYVHLMQVVPASVAPRVLLFPWPLSLPVGWEKISPGFFDAPGSARLLFPAMRELMGGDVQSLRPVVTVAFSSIEGFKELSAVNVEAARDVLQLHNAAVRETLSTCSGYECKEFNGSFMTTFAAPTGAVEWALTLQLALVAIPWPEDLLACEQAAIVLHPDTDQVLFRGLRCRVGIYAGPIDRVTPHPKTGRADYFGQPVNRAARLMTAALGGQVVLDQNLLDEVLDEWRRRQEVRRLATIPSDDGGSPPDEGSVATPSEMRTARSFVSAKSAHRMNVNRQLSAAATGTLSVPVSSNPSTTNLPDLSMYNLSPRGDGLSIATAAAAAAGLITGMDGAPTSPFGSPHGSLLCKPFAVHGLRDYATDGSTSPRVSLHRTLSPAGSGSTVAAPGALNTVSGGGATGSGGGGGTGGSGGASGGGNVGRPLDRILLEQRVQRSARSEPRIQRISRFGLSLPPAVRGHGGGGHGGGGHHLTSPRDGSSTGGGGSVRAGSGHAPLSPASTHGVTGSSLQPWMVMEGGSMTALQAPGAAGMLRRSPGGRVPTSPRGLLLAATAGNLGGIGLSPPSGSPAYGSHGGYGLTGGAAGTGAAGHAPSIAHMSWLSQALLTRTSPGGSVHSSVVDSSSYALAPGLELQPVDWDPAARASPGPRAKRRQRRASIGAIVENMLVAGRKASITMGGQGPHHLARATGGGGGGGGGGGSGHPSVGGSAVNRMSPVAALARLLPASPHSTSGGGGADGGRSMLHIQLSGDPPESPSTSNPMASPRSPSNLMGMLVRRMASSPLGPTPAAGVPLPAMPSAGVAGSGGQVSTSPLQAMAEAQGRQRTSHGGAAGTGSTGSSRRSGGGSQPSWSGGNALAGTRQGGPHLYHQQQLQQQQQQAASSLPPQYMSETSHRHRHHHHHHRLPPPPPPSPPQAGLLQPHASTSPSLSHLGAPIHYRPQLSTPLATVDAQKQALALQQRQRSPSHDLQHHAHSLQQGARHSLQLPPRSPQHQLPQLLHQHQQQHEPLHTFELDPAAGRFHHVSQPAIMRDEFPNMGSPAVMSAVANNVGSVGSDALGGNGNAAAAALAVQEIRNGAAAHAMLLSSRGSVAGAPGAANSSSGLAHLLDSHTHMGENTLTSTGAFGSNATVGLPGSELLRTSDGSAANTAVVTAAVTAAAVAAAAACKQRPFVGSGGSHQGLEAGGGGDGAGPSAPRHVPAAWGAAGSPGGDGAPSALSPSLEDSSGSPLPMADGSGRRSPLYHRNSSALGSSLLADGDVMPSFAANVVRKPSGALDGGDGRSSRGAQFSRGGSGRGASPGGGGETADSRTSPNSAFSDDLTIGDSSMGSRANAPTPMLTRSHNGSGLSGGGAAAAALSRGPAVSSIAEDDGYIVLHGNPMYGSNPGSTLSGCVTADGAAAGRDGTAAAGGRGGSETAVVEEVHSVDTNSTNSRGLPTLTMRPGQPPPSAPLSAVGFLSLQQSQPHSQQHPQPLQGGHIADSNGTLRLAMPPSSPPMANGHSGRRSYDGPPPAPSHRHPGSQAHNGSGNIAAAAAAAGSRAAVYGGVRRYSRNSSGGTQVAGTAMGSGESPSVSEAYGYGFSYGRSGTHDDSHSAANLHSGPPVRQATQGSKSGSLYGSAGAPGASALMSSLDAAALAAAVASGSGMVAMSPAPVDRVHFSQGGLSSAAGGLSGVAAFVGGEQAAGLTCPVTAAPPAVLASGPSARRRASSGTMGVSLRTAAEAAIHQMQLMSGSAAMASGHGHVSGGGGAAAAPTATTPHGLHQAHSGLQQQPPVTPQRTLRKSTSSRGRRGYGSSYDPAILALSGAPSGGPNLGGSGISSGGAAGGQVLTPRPLRTTSARRPRGPYDPIGGFILPPAVEQLAALVSQHGGLDIRASPPIDRIGVVTPRSGGGAAGGGGGGGGGGVGFYRSDGMSLRRSAPGHPLAVAIAAAAASASAAGASPLRDVNNNASVTTASSYSYTPSDILRTPTRNSGKVPVAAPMHSGISRSVSLFQAGFSPANSSAFDLTSMPVPPLLAMHPPIAPAPASSASLGHAPSPQSYAYPAAGSALSRYSATDALNAPLPQGLQLQQSGSTPTASVSRAGRSNVSHALAAAAAAAVAAGTGSSASGGTHGVRSNMMAMRSSTPTLPAVSASSDNTAIAGGASGGPAGAASGGSGGAFGTSALHIARLRASHPSLPDEVASLGGQSVSRDLSRPSDLAASSHGPATARSRWRSPRTPPHGDGDASSSAAGGGGPLASLDKLSHPGAFFDAAASAAAANNAGGGSNVPAGGAAQAGGSTGGLPGASGAGPKLDKENRPAVMAECYKITQQPAGGMGGGGNEVAQSITMIKYTNLKQELERAEEGEGDDVPVPTNMLLVPTVAVEVAIWSLGSFRLKGVTEPIKIVQVLPVSLEGRLSILNKAGLNRGKARCIERRVACLEVITLQLPDVSRLSCVSMGGEGTPGEDDGGGSSDGGGGAMGGMGNGGYSHADGLMMSASDELYGGGGNMGGGSMFDGTQSVPQWQPADLIGGDGILNSMGAAAAAMQAQGYGGGGGQGQRAPVVSGSPGEAANRWAAACAGGGLRGTPIREIDSSDTGLPPISEAITPASSPNGRSRDVLPMAAAALLMQQRGSGSGPQAHLGGYGSGGGGHDSNDGYGSLGSGSALGRRRGVFPPPPVAIPEGPISPPGGAGGAATAADVVILPPQPPPSVQHQGAGGGTAAFTLASTGSYEPDPSRTQSISLSYAAHRQAAQAAAMSPRGGGAGGGTSGRNSIEGAGGGMSPQLHPHPSYPQPSYASRGPAPGLQAAYRYGNASWGVGGFHASAAPAAGAGPHAHHPQPQGIHLPNPYAAHPAGVHAHPYHVVDPNAYPNFGSRGHAPGHGGHVGHGSHGQATSGQHYPYSVEGTSPGGMQVSTGLLPTSLAYLAAAPTLHGTHGSGDGAGGGGFGRPSGGYRGYSAMLAAGMDVGSACDTPPASGGDSGMGMGRSHGSSTHGAQQQQLLLEGYHHVPYAHAAAAVGVPMLDAFMDGGGGAAAAAAQQLSLLPERSSAGTPSQGGISPLVIDRTSSGFYRPYSSGLPGPPLTDRSSSGRYPQPSGGSAAAPPLLLTTSERTSSGRYAPPPLTASDRTSSGRYPPGNLPPGVSLTTDRSSSGRRNLGSLTRGEGAAAVVELALVSPRGSAGWPVATPSGLPPLPERRSPSGSAFERSTSGSMHGSGSGSPSMASGASGGGGGMAEARTFVRHPSQGQLPSRLGPSRSFTMAAAAVAATARAQVGGDSGGEEGEAADGGTWLEEEDVGEGGPLEPPVDSAETVSQRQQVRQQQERMAAQQQHAAQQYQQQQQYQQPYRQEQRQYQQQYSAARAAASQAYATQQPAGSGDGRGGASGRDSGGPAATSPDSTFASDPARVPTFATLAQQGSNASATAASLDFNNGYDVTVSVRSSMTGSAVGHGGGGRVSMTGTMLTAVESLRTFGLSHLPHRDGETSASELLRPFEEGQRRW